MIVIDIAVAGLAVAFLVAAWRVVAGPTPADRVVAADLLTFSLIGLVALVGTRLARAGTFDLVIVATLVAFLAAVSLARALTGGHR
ncbi:MULTISPECIES: monovalent cation/H+ antiporter complex subunit F [Cellulomonas]|uniref:Multicomponent Na+:H+ antiporter subunit F n=1 Tax=Cellulomonas iranensis TaxID=76862 RepID=A0ABU0GJU8_9CELL|nr:MULTISPECIES: monovalent cation/H+ antiporter complex subunit F [Cellulomonas]KSW30297.1 pesticidal protein Cry26Aa [Cellulomonas sp. B6]MDQ0425645.1 multicomponent Na+:H+ antiporter subunit F [Cellulomonas iranensis]TFH72072.1 pesticidal protein Cry26Aa [Cellulomonas sp. HD19AZ1]